MDGAGRVSRSGIVVLLTYLGISSVSIIRIAIVSLLLASGGAVPTSANAAQAVIYKCVVGGTTRYQDSPCTGAYERVAFPGAVDPAVGGSTSSRAAGGIHPPAQASGPTAVLPFRETGELALGMSDTLVLNRAGWGRPKRIARTRGPDGYREEWTYAARVDGTVRVLQFLNGHLTGMDLELPPENLAAVPSSTSAMTAANGGDGGGVDAPRGGRTADVVAASPVVAPASAPLTAATRMAGAGTAGIGVQPEPAFVAYRGYDPPVAVPSAVTQQDSAEPWRGSVPTAAARVDFSAE